MELIHLLLSSRIDAYKFSFLPRTIRDWNALPPSQSQACATYYAALLPRRGPHIASHSVCLSVCPSVPLLLPNVTSRHLANYNDTHVLLGTRAQGRISYGHLGRTIKFLFFQESPLQTLRRLYLSLLSRAAFRNQNIATSGFLTAAKGRQSIEKRGRKGQEGAREWRRDLSLLLLEVGD